MSWEQVAVSISEDVKALMQERGITEDDVKQVIYNGEQSGVKLFEGERKFLTKMRLDKFTVYADYIANGEAYELISAYCHRVILGSDNQGEQGE